MDPFLTPPEVLVKSYLNSYQRSPTKAVVPSAPGRGVQRIGSCLTPRWKLDRSRLGSPAASIYSVRANSSRKSARSCTLAR